MKCLFEDEVPETLELNMRNLPGICVNCAHLEECNPQGISHICILSFEERESLLEQLGFNLRDNSGNYKTTYSILKELAEKWKEVNEQSESM